MDSLVLVGTLLVSLAVIVTILGEVVTLLDYFKVPRPDFKQPIIAFTGLISVIFLLSALIISSVVPNGNSIQATELANNIAELAVRFSFFPFMLTIFQAGLQLNQSYRHVKLVRLANKYTARSLSLISIVLLPLIFIAFFIVIFYQRDWLSTLFPHAPLWMAVIFASIPVCFNVRKKAKEIEKKTHVE